MLLTLIFQMGFPPERLGSDPRPLKLLENDSNEMLLTLLVAEKKSPFLETFMAAKMERSNL